MTAYLIHGRRMTPDDAGFAEALAAAHAGRHRPLCLCLVEGLEMYVASLGDHFFLKRMPYTGGHHAPDCPSYEPPAELSGLGQVLGSAITEDPDSGVTSLKLGFSMSKTGGRSVDAGSENGAGSVTSDGTKLGLRGLLHYLWDEAELTRWHPGFAGKRSWATVRNHLLQAAEGKVARGRALHDRLYIPEIFSVEQRDQIIGRRVAQVTRALAAKGGTKPLMLVIAELKEIAPARYGCKAVLKHVPDQPFVLDEKLFLRVERRFAEELSMWGASDSIHMIAIATFGTNDAGVPTMEELSLMPVCAQWIPIENSYELQLIDRLVREGRSFRKGLRYNLGGDHVSVNIVLTDTEAGAVAMYVLQASTQRLNVSHAVAPDKAPTTDRWIWIVNGGPMPAIPERIKMRDDTIIHATAADASALASADSMAGCLEIAGNQMAFSSATVR